MNILFVGFRHGHIEALYSLAKASSSINIIGCIETDDEARESAQKRLGIEFSLKSYEEFLADKSVDAVAVGDYYGARGNIILKAINAGKHVIADKPVCINENELDAIATALEKSGTVLGCMLDLRYLPATATAKKIIESGDLGIVRNISFTGQHCLNYGVRPMWYFEEGKHGGTINDIAIHGIDLIRYITGLEFKEINAARQWNAYAIKQPDFKDCAVFMAQLENEGAVLADVSYSAPVGQWAKLPTYWNFDFWCEKGMLNLSIINNAVTVYPIGFEAPSIKENAPQNESFLTDFLLRIKGQKGILSNADIIKTSRTALKIQNSNR